MLRVETVLDINERFTDQIISTQQVPIHHRNTDGRVERNNRFKFKTPKGVQVVKKKFIFVSSGNCSDYISWTLH